MFTELENFEIKKPLIIEIPNSKYELDVSVDCEISESASVKKITSISIKQKGSKFPYQIMFDDEFLYPFFLKWVKENLEDDECFESVAKDAIKTAKEE